MQLNNFQRLPSQVLLSAVLGLVAALPGRIVAQTVAGQAYGAYASTPLGAVTQSPIAVLPPLAGTDGDMAAVQSGGMTVGGVLSTTFLHSITSGALGTAETTAQSVATTGTTSILNGLITAQSVTAMAASHRTASGAVSSSTGSTFGDLVVAGSRLATGEGVVAPNTRIALPGVGYVVLNEQIASGDGVTSSGLTVNMIHVYLQNPLGGAAGEIVVGSATSSVGS
ncbi:MAG TPA: choice-of-anchor P family protein [Gemmatimonadales bacterium]|jgi:hypothetical protein|nr:choice-of-anchor P family protein [Gemmatimonadales bacterium]